MLRFSGSGGMLIEGKLAQKNFLFMVLPASQQVFVSAIIGIARAKKS